MKTSILFEGVSPFKFQINYIECGGKALKRAYDNHAHNRCEVYINLSGDVSFMVENSIYPISSGNAVITRPYENHHCIYHSPAAHRHFCIHFSPFGNEQYFNLFFNRSAGENNLIVFSADERMKLVQTCRTLLNPELEPALQYFEFFNLIHLLNLGHIKKDAQSPISAEIAGALDMININLANGIAISDLAESAHMSINTFERHFKNIIGMPPSKYIFQKKLAHAASMLSKGCSVHEACSKSGFSDYSHFISRFKRDLGMTPLQYKKECALKNGLD